MTQKCVEDRLTDVLDILAVLNTDFPPSPVQEKEQDETLIAPSKEHSRGSLDSSDQTIQDSSIPNNTGNQPNIPPYLPSDNNNPKPPPKPSHIRTLLISAIGIVAIVTLMVWLIPPERQENDDSTQEETTGPVFPSENQITTVIDTSEEIYQNIDAAQDKMRQEFKSFSSAIDALHREIINKKKIPTTLQAQQWYEQTTEKVVALKREGRNVEESQKSLMDTNMKASTAFIQQGKILLQEDLSQDQQLQLRAAIDKLEKLHNTLRTTYSQQRETTQRQLSTLDLAVKKVRDRFAAIPPPPAKQPPDIGRKLARLQGEIHSFNQAVEDMLKTFEDSMTFFTTHLSNLQIQIQQIGENDSFHPSNTQKLVGLHEKVQTLQQDARTVYTRRQTKQEELKKTLQMAIRNYQSISGKSLESTQKIRLGKLDTILKNNQARLSLFPPDSWKKLQDLSMNTRALLATTKETLAKKTIAVTGTKRKLEDLVQKAIRLQTDIKGFRSQTDLQYQSLSRQITTVDTQIDLLKSQPHDETLMTTVAKIEESLGSLEETLPLHLAKSDQQFPTFVERQTAIQAKLNSLTSTPLAPSLDQPASQVQHMLTAIQQDLQNLKQVSWNDLSATLEATHRAFSKFTQNLVDTERGQQIALSDLAKRAATLQSDLKGFRSQTGEEHRHLGTQIETIAITVSSLESHVPEKILDEKMKTLIEKFRNLHETIQQHSVTYAQQFPTFKERQVAIQEKFNNLTAAPLASPLDRQTSHIRQTLTLIQQDLQDLKQVNWKVLFGKLGTTLQTFTKSYDGILLIRILDDFTAAYERRDILHLQLMTSMSESRSRNLDLMFKKYTTIDTHTEIVSMSESQTKVKVIIDKLVNKEGKTITPNFIIRETIITIPKKNGEWGKIQW